nr:hypothetical protein [Tanacetum cinerariifolium]
GESGVKTMMWPRWRRVADNGSGVVWCGRLWVGVIEAGRRVVESDIRDRLDRVMGNIFRFAENARRKSFPVAAARDGGGCPTGGVAGNS